MCIRTSGGGVDVHTAGREVALCGSGAVHLVLRVQNEHHVHGAHVDWVRPVRRVRATIQHVEKVFCIPEALVRGRRALARAPATSWRRQLSRALGASGP